MNDSIRKIQFSKLREHIFKQNRRLLNIRNKLNLSKDKSLPKLNYYNKSLSSLNNSQLKKKLRVNINHTTSNFYNNYSSNSVNNSFDSNKSSSQSSKSRKLNLSKNNDLNSTNDFLEKIQIKESNEDDNKKMKKIDLKNSLNKEMKRNHTFHSILTISINYSFYKKKCKLLSIYTFIRLRLLE